eukprot:760563-Hanusia_phi.AAC.5
MADFSCCIASPLSYCSGVKDDASQQSARYVSVQSPPPRPRSLPLPLHSLGLTCCTKAPLFQRR